MNDHESRSRRERAQKLTRGEMQLTDTTNAERMVRHHGQDLRYCETWKKWLHWDGRHWCIDTTDEVQALAKETVRGMYVEASRLGDDRDRIDLEKHAKRCEGVPRRAAMVQALSWERVLSVKPEELDTDRWLFNCRNGTVDLRTGKLRPHDRKDLVMKLAGTEYIEGADCPRWKRFLYEVLKGNEELIFYLAKAAGMALTGDMNEQTLFILYGTGANGKSTFLNTLLGLFGDYALSTPPETFMRRTGDKVWNDIAHLKGARLVTTFEAEEGKRFSEPLIKQMTGGDRMVARFLYSEYFEFEPTCKIFIATNHKPVICGTDHAIWRRIRLIPFTVTIPPDDQDGRLPELLREEYPGILNWLIEGCLRWQAERLGTPPTVQDATETYRNEMDVIGSFLRERCDLERGKTVKSRELFKAYAAWCEENNETAGSERFLALRLLERGYGKHKKSDAHYWRDIGLKSDVEDS